MWKPLALALAQAWQEDRVLEVLVEVAVPGLGARLANVSLLDEQGEWLTLVSSRHSSDQIQDEFATYSASAPLPSTHALQSGRPVLLHDLAERDRRYPALAGVEVEDVSFAILPLTYLGESLGVLGLGWPDGQDFDSGQVAELVEVADLAAAALWRARAHRREQQARARAEDHADLLKGLAGLTGQLAGMLSEQDVAGSVLDSARRIVHATAASLTAYDGSSSPRPLGAIGLPVLLQGADFTDRFPSMALVRELVATRSPVLVTSRADRDRRYPDMSGNKVPQEAWANLPLLVHHRLVGVLAFGWDEPRAFDEQEIDLLRTVAQHVAIALDRARLYQNEQASALLLQRAMLPPLPAQAPGLDVGAVYHAAALAREVGGDWYDVFTLPDGRVGISVGDVVGHDLTAAGAMVRLQTTLRAVAMDGADPGHVLTRLDQFTDRIKGAQMATVGYAVYNPATGCLDYAAAGHPPPLLASPGVARYLDQALSPPLGFPDLARRHASTLVAPGSRLLWYSDGLIECRHHDQHDRLDDLRTVAQKLHEGPSRSAEEWSSQIHQRMLAAHPSGDDVVVLTVAVDRASSSSRIVQ